MSYSSGINGNSVTGKKEWKGNKKKFKKAIPSAQITMHYPK